MNAYKKMMVGVLLLSSLGLTACSQDVPSDKNPVAAGTVATATATETATPGATESTSALAPASTRPTDNIKGLPEANKEQIAAAEKARSEMPMNIDIESVYENNRSDAVKALDESLDVKEGIRAGLATYAHLTSLSVWTDDRDATQDYTFVAPYAAANTEADTLAFDPEFLKAIQADVQANGAMNYIPTMPGGITVGNKFHKLDTTTRPEITYDLPGVALAKDKMDERIIISGTRTFSYPVYDGKSIAGSNTYYIEVTPNGDGAWLVSNMGWEMASDLKVVTTPKVVND